MNPNKSLISIDDNENKIKQFLMDLIVEPRIKALQWSQITHQTPNLKIGYPGQHLASLITGMTGVKTGARGDDLVDGTEVKSCSRVDQLDKCKDCDEKVLRVESVCPKCNSVNIQRNNDSKWLFTIRNENDLSVLTKQVERVFLIISDYLDFESGNFDDIRIQAFEIWTHSQRNQNFNVLMSSYYEEIYSTHKQKNHQKTPAPKNFWPYSFQFYMCNPIKVFSCVIKNANTIPDISIHHLVKPDASRFQIQSELMPISLLNDIEIEKIVKNHADTRLEKYKKLDKLTKAHIKEIYRVIPFVTEDMRTHFDLRKTGKISEAKLPYLRGQ